MRKSMGQIICTTVLLAAAGSWAADVQMSVEPELISLLDRAVLTFEFIDAEPESIAPPEIDGLEIAYMKNLKSRSEFTDLNTGKKTVITTHKYLITPAREGDYVIGPVHVKYGNEEKDLTAHLKVIKKADDAESQKISDLMYTRTSLKGREPYVYEPFSLEFKVFVRDGIQVVWEDVFGRNMFAIKGGIPENGLDGDPDLKFVKRGREELNGIIFNTYTFAMSAKALTAGTFVFQPKARINIVIPAQDRRPFGMSDPFFGDFFGRQETRPIILDSNKLEVRVKPIPLEGRPDTFTGGVGKMNFEVDIGPSTLKAGEPITVRMRVTGEGNLEKITPPGLEEMSGLKLYEVRTVPTDNPNEVCFEQVAIPTIDTIEELPPISFSYFNTQTADFRTITSDPFPITVEAGPDQSAQVMAAQPVAPSSTEVLGHDIAYLKPMPARWRSSGESGFHRTSLFRFVLVLPALLAAITGLAVSRRNRLEKDEARARRHKAPKAARQHIQRAEHAMKSGDATAFYESLWTALAEYFGHRLNLAPGQVTLQTVLERIPDEDGAIERLYNTIEQRRYAIQGEQHDRDDMKNLLKQLVNVLKRCERIKR